MKCDIIMPVWNNKRLTSRCLNSIFDNTHCDYRLIIIDNASDSPTLQYLEQVKSSRPNKVLLITNEENVGFTKAANQGIKASSGDYVCINNNDIIVSDGWLEEMIYVAENHSDIGIVNPSSNFGKRKPWSRTFKQYADLRTFGRHGQYSETASPVGFCYLIKREVIDKIGLLDEGYSPGYFEDTEYALRAQAAGYKSVFADGAFVFHLERASFKKRRFNSFFKQSEERFYSLHKRPQRILYILAEPDTTFYQRIREDSYNFAKNANWVSIFLKRSAPNINLHKHTYIRVFRFSDILFNIAALVKVLFKKKRFSKILVDNEGLAQRFRMLNRYHKAQVEVLECTPWNVHPGGVQTVGGMMKKKTIKEMDIKGKKVLIRVDFNVPLDTALKITDDARIKAAIPTIEYAIKQGAKVILMSHLGRPDGKVVDKMRMDPVAKQLGVLLSRQVKKLNDCIGPEVKTEINKMKNGDVVLLENLRFHAEEEKNDPAFAKELASLGEVYVNDAFGTAHRAHASTEGVTKYLPSVAGFLLQKEIEYLGDVLENPNKPFAAILGGAKVSDKIGVIENLLKKVDIIVIGGAMAYTFLEAKGKNIGSSRLEVDKLDVAESLLKKAEVKGVKIILPVDHIIADKPDLKANIKEQPTQDIPDGWMGVDIGPKTIELFKQTLKPAKTIVWNGPLGIFEMEPFSWGTKKVAEFIVVLKGATTVIGGGDTAAAVSKFGLEHKMTHISTGGGASLEFMEGRSLPGVVALNDRDKSRCRCYCN